MNPQVNWQRIRSELQRLADVDKLKAEVHRIGGELRRFDLQAVLSPKAADKVKEFEKRYNDLMRRLHVAQRHVDRELSRILKQIKTHREDAANVFSQQRDKLEKVSTDFRSRFKAKRRPKTASPSDTPAAKSAPADFAAATQAGAARAKGRARPKTSTTGARAAKAKPRGKT